MVPASPSIISSAPSFPTSSSSYASSTYACIGIRPFHHSKRHLFPFRRTPRLALKLCASASQQSIEDGSADKFLENNSVADFMRFKRGSHKGNGELQTAVVSYRKRFPWSLLWPFLQVDLVSTIHIADKEYFSTLQRELEPYDCVLYEMVASRESLENRRSPVATKRLKSSRARGFNILGCIQRQMARILMLDFQLDCLDYQAENWYHADLDFETFKLLQLEKGESFFTFARDMTLRSTKAMVQPASIPEDLGPWRSKLLWASRVLPMPLVGLLIIGSVCADVGSQASEYPELEALSRLDLGAAMKVFLARRLTSDGACLQRMEQKISELDPCLINKRRIISGPYWIPHSFSSPGKKSPEFLDFTGVYDIKPKQAVPGFTQVTAEVEEKSVIIGERNKVAIDALRRAIDDGHGRIAILYGGGHMPDLGRRLREEFDLVPARVQWITAWSIRNRDIENSPIPFLKTMAEVSGWPLNRYQTLALLIFSSVLAVDLWFWELFFGTTVSWISEAAAELSQYIDSL